MEDISLSDVVMSLCGRDEGRLFVVVDVDGEYLMLADGKRRKVEKPKRKKLKHTRLIGNTGQTRVREKLLSGEKITNAELRRALSDCGSDTEGGTPVG